MTMQELFKCRALRIDGMWAVTCKALPNLNTQGRSFVEAKSMAREAIALLLDRPEGSFRVRLIPEIPE